MTRPPPPASLQDALVRGAAASALLALYSQRDNVAPLHDFTERFLSVGSERRACSARGAALHAVSAAAGCCSALVPLMSLSGRQVECFIAQAVAHPEPSPSLPCSALAS